jgi:phosphoglycolate phosphatase-like HAD superfamily hydrolase
MLKAKACLFDFDGTLVDTMEGFADIAGEIIHKHHPEISFSEARAKYLETSGIPFFQQLELICPQDPTNQEKAAYFEETKKDGFFRAKFSQEVKDTLNKLREAGILVGVSSNNFQSLIEEFIKKSDLTFDIVLGYKDGFSKGKDHFDYILKNYSLTREDLVFVGDSLKDAEKGIENKVRFIGLTGTFSSADFYKIRKDIKVINSLKELLTL